MTIQYAIKRVKIEEGFRVYTLYTSLFLNKIVSDS